MLPDIHAAGVSLVFISARGDAEKSASYLARFNKIAHFPATLLIDPTKGTHKALGFRRGIYRSIVTPIVKAICDGVPTSQMLEGARLGWENFFLVGDSWQQGGTAVFDGGGGDGGGSGGGDGDDGGTRTDGRGCKCTYLHAEDNPADHRPMSGILAAAGVNPARDVDYVASLTKFLNHRRAGLAPEAYQSGGGGGVSSSPTCESGECQLSASTASAAAATAGAVRA